MTAELIKIYQTKKSINGNSYTRLAFKLSDGKWAKTDVCSDYRNYSEWARLMKFGIGTKIKDFKMINSITIDADSEFMFMPQE